MFPTLSATYNATRAYNGPETGGAGAHRRPPADQARIRRPSFRASPGPGTSTSGARCAGRSRATPPRRRSAPPTSTTSSLRRRRSSPPPISICARPIRCTICSFATTVEYKKTLDIVRNQFKAGFSVTEGDVATAEAQVFTTEAQAINALVQRAQFEHAIAILIGRPPAELSIGTNPARRQHSKNSGHGSVVVARTASRHRRCGTNHAGAKRAHRRRRGRLFPRHQSVRRCFSGPAASRRLSTSPTSCGRSARPARQVLFEGGLRGAQVDAARAVYWQSVANYRQTVLTAFQQVEDQLVAIRLLKQQLVLQQKAVQDQRRAVDVFINQFRAGTAAYTTVVKAEIILLSDEESSIDRPPKPVPRQRHPDRGAWRRLGHQSRCRQRKNWRRTSRFSRSFRPMERGCGSRRPTIPQAIDSSARFLPMAGHEAARPARSFISEFSLGRPCRLPL